MYVSVTASPTGGQIGVAARPPAAVGKRTSSDKPHATIATMTFSTTVPIRSLASSHERTAAVPSESRSTGGILARFAGHGWVQIHGVPPRVAAQPFTDAGVAADVWRLP